MDVIALHAAGFTNAVATLGTAITAEQARMMSRYTKKVIISYDADEAGQKAAMRAIKMLSEVGLDVTILKIPDAKDPDEYIKHNGADKFKRLLEGSKTKYDYNMDNILSRYDVSVSAEKIKALKELTKLISDTYSSAERDVYIQVVAKTLSVDAKSIKADVDRALAAQYRARKREESEKVRADAVGYNDRVNPDFAKAPAVAKNEEHVLGLLLTYPEHRKKVFEEELLDDGCFFTELNKRIFRLISDHRDDDPMMFANESFTEDEVGRMARMKHARTGLSNSTEIFLDAVRSLKTAVEKKSFEKTVSYDALNKLINKRQDEES
jgi:DNA primase